MEQCRFLMIDRLLRLPNGHYHLYFFKNEKMNTIRKRKELRLLSKIGKIDRISVVDYNTKKENPIFVTEYKKDKNKVVKILRKYSFKEYQKIFQKENGILRCNSNSKVFGRRKTDEKDIFVTSLLKEITNDDTFLYDNEGIDITEKLLNHNPTRGFDIDLFDSKYNIVYEFLKTENAGVTNATAHPMRYSWTHNTYDNSKKFISLYHFSKAVGASLRFITYSMREQDANYIKLISDAVIDDKLGFLEDKEYIISAPKFKLFLEYSIKEQNDFLIEDNKSVYLSNIDFKYKKYKNKLNTLKI